MAKHPGMKQIANIAGVSVTTVSRALNNPEMLKPETRRRIMQAIEDHGYIYNAAAGDLSRGRGRWFQNNLNEGIKQRASLHAQTTKT